MRVSGLLHVITLVACLTPLAATAQTAAQRRAAASAAAEESIEPYHKHRDTRHGHDHYYPDRGAIVRDLPVGTIGTSYAGVSYRYHDGIWLEPRGPAYMVVSPPIGLIAPTLPLYSTVVAHGAESFLYCNDTYYRPRPDLGGYEVVNDPAMEPGSGPTVPEALVGGQMPAPVAAGGAVGAAGSGGTGFVSAAPGVGVALASAPVGAVGAVPVVAREGSLSREAVALREASVPREANIAREAGVSREATTAREAGVSREATTAREAGPLREASLSGGTMPGVATPSSGAVAASVPAPSLGAGAGTSATAAPAGVGSAAAGVGSAAPVAGSAPAGSGSASTVATPTAVGSAVTGSVGTQKVPKVFLYPKNGQSADQQARDRYDCYRFAVGQSGFDPMRTSANPPAAGGEQQSDFERAQSACFEGRGYSNR